MKNCNLCKVAANDGVVAMSADRQVEAEPVQLKQRTKIPSSRQQFQAADILPFQAARDPIMTSARAFKLFTKYYLVGLNSSQHIRKYKSHSFIYMIAAGKLTVQIYFKFYKQSTQKKSFFLCKDVLPLGGLTAH